MDPIYLSKHAQGYTERRGFTFQEIEQAIRTAPWQPSDQGGDRLECSKEFPFDARWNGKHYARKRVRPIFVEEEFGILVITVYTYYQ